MQFNAPGGSSNPLLPPTPPPTSNGEEICRDFLKVYTLCYIVCRNIWPFLQQGACFRENCKYSHAHAEGLCAQLPQVRTVFCWRKFGFETNLILNRRLRDCAFRFSLSLFFSFLIKLTELMSLYSCSFYSRSNRRRSPYAETSKTGGVLDPGALLNLDGPPKISFSSTQTDAGAGNAPDDKKKGSSQKLTTYEQKILLLL